MKILFITIFVLLLSACAPSTIEGLREEHANRYSFETDANYQAVYQKILSTAEKCYQKGMITAKMVVEGNLAQDTETASVTVALRGALGVDTHMAVDISALTEEQTKVVVFNALSTWNSAAQAVKEWVVEDSTDCKPKSG